MADKKPADVKGPLRSNANVDLSILSEEDIAGLRTLAAQNVDKEARNAAKAKLLRQFEAEARQKTGLSEESVEVYIDLAPYADRIALDNVVYLQGTTHTVRASVAATMYEIMARTWNHQAEIDGKSENFYRRTRGQMVTPQGVVSNLLRA